jgi:hypothetical protein
MLPCTRIQRIAVHFHGSRFHPLSGDHLRNQHRPDHLWRIRISNPKHVWKVGSAFGASSRSLDVILERCLRDLRFETLADLQSILDWNRSQLFVEVSRFELYGRHYFRLYHTLKNNSYRPYHWFGLKKRDYYFRVTFDHFWTQCRF